MKYWILIIAIVLLWVPESFGTSNLSLNKKQGNPFSAKIEVMRSELQGVGTEVKDIAEKVDVIENKIGHLTNALQNINQTLISKKPPQSFAAKLDVSTDNKPIYFSAKATIGASIASVIVTFLIVYFAYRQTVKTIKESTQTQKDIAIEDRNHQKEIAKSERDQQYEIAKSDRIFRLNTGNRQQWIWKLRSDIAQLIKNRSALNRINVVVNQYKEEIKAANYLVQEKREEIADLEACSLGGESSPEFFHSIGEAQADLTLLLDKRTALINERDKYDPDIREYTNQINYLQYAIQLSLSPNPSECEQCLIQSIKDLKNDLDSDDFDPIHIIESSKALLKIEWNRIKHTAESGAEKDTKKEKTKDGCMTTCPLNNKWS